MVVVIHIEPSILFHASLKVRNNVLSVAFTSVFSLQKIVIKLALHLNLGKIYREKVM